MPRAFRQCPEWDYVRQAKEELQVPRRAAVGAYAKLSECQDSTKECCQSFLEMSPSLTI